MEKIEQYFLNARELEKNKNYEGAIIVYTKLIEINPNPDKRVHYYNRGVLYGYLGELDKAIADYDKALELNPNHTASRANRSVAYSDKGEWDKAIADSEKCVEIDPGCFADINLPGFYYERGSDYLRKGDYDRAILDYLHIIEVFQNYCAMVDVYIKCASAYLPKSEYNNDLPPKKWTQRRVGGSITAGSITGGVQWMGKGVSLSGLTGILSFQR